MLALAMFVTGCSKKDDPKDDKVNKQIVARLTTRSSNDSTGGSTDAAELEPMV